MKKLIIISAALIMSILLTGCRGDDKEKSANYNSESSISVSDSSLEKSDEGSKEKVTDNQSELSEKNNDRNSVSSTDIIKEDSKYTSDSSYAESNENDESELPIIVDNGNIIDNTLKDEKTEKTVDDEVVTDSESRADISSDSEEPAFPQFDDTIELPFIPIEDLQ